MEYLDNTMELFSENTRWEGKMEPPSPSHVTLEQSSSNDSWLNEDYFATNELTIEELFTFDLPPEKKLFTDQLLTDLSQDIKDEQWLNEKMVIPSLDDYPPPPMEPMAVKKQDTQELLQEFESVYDAVELTHLTPPQTPPQTSPQRITIGDAGQCIDQTFIYQEPILYGTLSAPATFYALAQEQQQHHGEKCENNLEFSLASLPSVEHAAGGNMIEIIQSPMPEDIDHEMELVDELVRSRAKDLPDWTDDDNSTEFTSSPASSSPRSEISFGGSSSYSHDDEWLPEVRTKAPKAAGSLVAGGVLGGGIKKRSRPYARGSEDKKSRKKEQNKNAATRYRKKKKMEVEEVLEVERALQKDHDKLKAEATDLKREIKYLKGLMREVYKAKGLLD